MKSSNKTFWAGSWRQLCWLLMIAAATIVQSQAQTDFAQTMTVDLPSGGAISFQPQLTALNATAAQPQLTALNLKQQTVSDGGKLLRILYDNQNNTVFAYEIVAKPTTRRPNDRRGAAITFAPLAASAVREIIKRLPFTQPGIRLGSKPPRVSTLPTSGYQFVADGDTLIVDLLVNAPLNTKITDKLRFAVDRRMLESAPRDLTVKEIELAVSDSVLEVNNNFYSIGNAGRRYNGSLLWFHLPQTGLFVVSLAPQEGYDFQKTAVLENDKIEFQIDGKDYRWTSGTPFLPLEGRWNLWVLHLPHYTPPTVALGALLEDRQPEQSNAARQTARAVEKLKKRSRIRIEAEARRTGVAPKSEVKEELTATADEADLPRIAAGAADSLNSLLPKN